MSGRRSNSRSLFALPAGIIIAVVAGLFASARSHWDRDAVQRKADYIYLEAQTRDAEGESDAAYDLMREAHRLNPSDRTVAYELARFLLPMSDRDSFIVPRVTAMIDSYLEQNPDDSYASTALASLLEYTDDTERAIEVSERSHLYHPTNSSLTLRLAMLLAGTGQAAHSRRAVELIDTVLAAEGDIPDLLINKVRILYALGDTAAILSDVNDMISKGSSNGSADPLVMAGMIYASLGRDSLALNTFSQACRVDSTSGPAFYSLAQQYLDMGDTVAYEHETYEAMLRPSLDPEVKTQLLRQYISENIADTTATPRVLALLNTLEEQHPHEAAVHNIYASYLAHLRRYSQAAQQQRHSLDIDPSQQSEWIMLVQLLSVDGRYEEGIKAVDRALKYFPDDVDLYINKAVLTSHIPRYEQPATSFALIDSALALIPQNDYLRRSTLVATKGDLLQQFDVVADTTVTPEVYYEEAITLFPDNALALNNYAYYLAVAGRDLDRAQKMAERSMLLDPDNLNTVDTYAWVMFKKKDFQRAREIIDSALDDLLANDNNAVEAYDHAGDIYFMTGDADEAVEFWKKALEVEPDNALIKRKVANKAYFAE